MTALSCQRHLFEIPRDIAYFEAAAYAPLPMVVRRAGEAGVAAKSHPWSHPRDHDQNWVDRTRAAAAGLIGASPADIAIVSAVSGAMAVAARHLDLTPGGRVLRVADEFPSVALTVDRLAQEKGLMLDIVPRPTDGDWTSALLDAIPRPGAPPLALAALTPLHWADGARIDLDRIAPAVHATGAALVIDATQAVGAMPVDVARWRPDFLAFPTYKWVVGPYSTAFLYAAPHRQDGLPMEMNSNNCPGGTPAPGARRYDRGERNDPIAMPMAGTCLELVRDWGPQRVADYLAPLTDRLAALAADLGWQVLPTAHRVPHMLGLRHPGGLPPDCIDRLRRHGLHASDRLGVLRLAPHLWVDVDDMERAERALMAVSG